MNYKVLWPKYLHTVRIIVHASICIILALILQAAVMATEWAAAIIVVFISLGEVMWFLFIINKFIYAKIDTKKREIIYGNFFFHQEVSIDEVTRVGNVFFTKKIVKVMVKDKIFYLNLLEKDALEFLK